MATLSEVGSSKIVGQARTELNKVLEAKTAATDNVEIKTKSEPPSSAPIRAEVTEAAVRFTEGVDVITETLILILGKFNTIILRTTLGMGFGAVVLITCLGVARVTYKTALVQEGNTKEISALTAQLKEALTKLDNIQTATNSTEQKVDAVQQTADSKPSIEIIPDRGRPGSAKVVIRSAVNPMPPEPSPSPSPSSSSAPTVEGMGLGRWSKHSDARPASAPPEAARYYDDAAQSDLVEIPIQLPAAR